MRVSLLLDEEYCQAEGLGKHVFVVVSRTLATNRLCSTFVTASLYPREFYELPTLELARQILGAKLTTDTRGVRTSGMIVEVEAYHGANDAASHSFAGPTPRNQVMFGPPGYCYVYFIYGVHHCVNIVSEPPGVGAAVLIRAVEPVDGIATMRRRRGSPFLKNLTNGPGKLCCAMKIDRSHNGEPIFDSPRIELERYFNPPSRDIASSRRIGISRAIELEWRFYLRGNPFVSRG